MPELPEVEVTRRGILNALDKATISKVYFDDKLLRKPFSKDLFNLENAKVLKIERRAKYIVITTTQGYLVIHLGMTGHLSVLEGDKITARGTHDHFELTTQAGVVIRYNDTRRFGLILYFAPDNSPYDNELLASLGPEPLTDDFNAEYLFNKLKRYKKSIKQTIMDNAVVVGVGNIYASEVLFLAKIHPERKANSITLEECQSLVKVIKEVLIAAIAKGGTTIRDFEGADGKMGYFVQDLFVYGHAKEPCKNCGTEITTIVQGQRSTYYCPCCQKLNK